MSAMDDPGYTDYSDPRLQPPDINEPDEESAVGSYRMCAHGGACLRMLRRIIDFELLDPDDEEIADRLECEWCDQWEG